MSDLARLIRDARNAGLIMGPQWIVEVRRFEGLDQFDEFLLLPIGSRAVDYESDTWELRQDDDNVLIWVLVRDHDETADNSELNNTTRSPEGVLRTWAPLVVELPARLAT